VSAALFLGSFQQARVESAPAGIGRPLLFWPHPDSIYWGMILSWVRILYLYDLRHPAHVTMKKTIKIVLAILLFLCLLAMPYGYFQLVRYAALVGFAILAYDAYESGHKTQAIVFVCLAILFQPLYKIGLGRHIWNLVDVVVGVGLLLSVLFE
jgi:hypothetical protein